LLTAEKQAHLTMLQELGFFSLRLTEMLETFAILWFRTFFDRIDLIFLVIQKNSVNDRKLTNKNSRGVFV